jgi:hypothetical protein
MPAADPRSDAYDRLDELLDRFVEGGYSPEGAEIDDDGGGHERPGHGHGAEPSVREFEHRGTVFESSLTTR